MLNRNDLTSKRLSLALLLLLLPFQNCGGNGFEVQSVATPSQQGQAIIPSIIPSTPSIPITTPTPFPGIVFSENPSSIVLAANAVAGVQANEIFQRKDNGLATINLKLNSAPASSQAAYFNISLLNSSNQRERVLASGARNSETSFSFEFATGLAARRVRLSLHDTKGVEQLRWDSPGFSVGEVFLAAGQSNSATHGQFPTTAENSLNRAIDPTNKSWVALADPMPYATNWSFPDFGSRTNPGGSPWPSFADELSAKLQVPVAVVSVGWGGSAVESWKQGNTKNYFSRLVLGAQALPSCGFRAVLWHQGESDAIYQTGTANYQASFKSVVDSFRGITGCHQNWMLARATYTPTDSYGALATDQKAWSSQQQIREAQNLIGQQPTFMLGPDTDLLLGGGYRYDNLHFTVNGLRLHGKLWAQRILVFFGQSQFQQEKDLIPEVQSLWSLYRNILSRTDSDMEKDREGLRYWVQKLSLGVFTLAQISATFSNSDEAFIRQVYVQTFARQPTWEELSNWLNKLAAGIIQDRTQLKNAILATK